MNHESSWQNHYSIFNIWGDICRKVLFAGWHSQTDDSFSVVPHFLSFRTCGDNVVVWAVGQICTFKIKSTPCKQKNPHTDRTAGAWKILKANKTFKISSLAFHVD